MHLFDSGRQKTPNIKKYSHEIIEIGILGLGREFEIKTFYR